MCLLVESIKVKDGIIHNIEYHNRRLNYSRSTLFNAINKINLSDYIVIPEQYSVGLVKCRVLYKENIKSVEFHNYNFRLIEELVLIEDNDINYEFKYTDRKKLDYYTAKVAPAIPLFIKNGGITDTAWANVVFYDGTNFFTPAFPLLRGTKREKLIEQKIIIEEDIKVDQINNYTTIFIINSMIDLEDKIGVPISKIKQVSNEF
ncbi:MAG: aminotransferase class IV [Melioribacteraceae bacterium]|nr:aminotransferase class IV [Melioribacteraceae bacterium]